MKRSATTLASVLALAIVTACGGGGSGGITELEAAAAPSPPPTAERVITIVGRERASINVPRIDPLMVHRVQAELDKIERALSLVDDGKAEKHEALEVVRDARLELQKNRPNKLKLRSLLSGLVQGAQMLDGVKSAGDSLGQLVPMV